MVSLALMVKKIFTKNCSGVHYFLPDFSSQAFLVCSHAYMYFKKKVSHILQKVLDLFR